jgi:hypothetical protein
MHLPPDPSWCARLRAAAPVPEPSPPAESVLSGPAPARPPLPQGSPYRYREIPAQHTCELCGTVMYDHNCKIVCPNCGYKRDCSDP